MDESLYSSGRGSCRNLYGGLNCIFIYECWREYAHALVCCASAVVNNICSFKQRGVRATVQAVGDHYFNAIRNVRQAPPGEVVNSSDIPAKFQEPLRHMAAQEARSACYEGFQRHSLHRRT